MTNDQSSHHPTLLTISQASRVLGVTEVTLRQWTSEGKIEAFITPGGHRRYSESELKKFMGTQHRVQGIKDLVAKIELTPAQEVEIAHTRFTSTSWYKGIDRDSRAKLGEAGRKVHELVITYISKQNKREETLELARETGRDFGVLLVGMGLSLTDAMEAFMLHRAPLVSAATELMKKRKSLNERAAEAIPLVTQITDEVLLALVTAYQDHMGSGGNGSS